MVTDVKLQKLDCFLDNDQDPEQWYCTVRGAIVPTNVPVGYDMTFTDETTVTQALDTLKDEEGIAFV